MVYTTAEMLPELQNSHAAVVALIRREFRKQRTLPAPYSRAQPVRAALLRTPLRRAKSNDCTQKAEEATANRFLHDSYVPSFCPKRIFFAEKENV